ncbi:Adenylate and Guanylate cyclase catalytic domain containing protein [Trichomonas vaginalis G3]|uniref:adenylate cyclase n=1 Tax=Trichomonas vaginalis (strain ATCC PRA-98 / G3) TaxID=412133 RepID=A2DJR4_TRIV3|nr:adenylate cyclase protein [Trichomonas vaginalis G3]EAY19278.1 Adenylate and Guanylate cyclase catalytic domain containing protein [Trichomonas vaginalis G3]KAI5527180.1 adenylate cyclase protein [Trichomonas vaginalis G3]|eukprot:XP_001580264.1 Adenylate and Guanylate cyclase catalytic domain containing protein [Trichomonas vaginalis G3]
MIFFWVLAVLESIADIFTILFPEALLSDIMILEVILLILAFVLSEIIISKFYHTVNSDKPNDSLRRDVELLDLNKENEEFMWEDANNKNSNTRLVFLILNDPDQAIKFAKFCSINSENKDLKVDCFRYLALMHKLDSDSIREIMEMTYKEVSLSKRQLLCDLQYEVISIRHDSDILEQFINHLTDIMNECREVYFRIIDMISMDQPDNIELELIHYYQLCKKFEKHAQVYSIIILNSRKLAHSLSSFYTQYKADANLAMAWRSAAESPEMAEDSNGNYKFRNSKKFSSKSFEVQAAQSFSNQLHCQKIKSLGVRSFLFFLFIFIAVVSTISIYRITPSKFTVIALGYSANISQSMKSLLLNPANTIFNMSTRVLSNCSSEYAAKMSNISDLKQIENFHTFISNISNQIYQYNLAQNNKENLLKVWASTSDYLLKNLTLHAAESSLATVFESITSCKCSNTSVKIINVASELYNSTIYSIRDLYEELYTNLNKVVDDYTFIYLVYAIVVITILAVLLIVIGFISITRRNVERKYFWSSLIEIDSVSLSELRKRLLNGRGLMNEIKTNEVSKFEFDNMLGSDEIDGSVDSSDILSEADISVYKPINELAAYERPINRSRRVIKWLNGTAAYLVFSILFFAIFGASVGTYERPIKFYFDRMIYFDMVTSTVVQAASKTQETVNEAILDFTNVVISSESTESNTVNVSNEFVEKIINNNFYYNESKIHQNDIQRLNVLLNQGKELIHYIYGNITAFYESNYSNITLLELSSELAYIDLNYTVGNISLVLENRINKYIFLYKVYLIGSRVSSAGLSVLFIFYLVFRLFLYHIEFNGYKNMLLIIPTTSKQAITMAIDLFNGSSKESKYNEVSLSRHIIKQSLNSILMVSSTGIIQDMNTSAISLLDCKKEDVIQQDIRNILTDVNENVPLQLTYSQIFDRIDDGTFDLTLLSSYNSIPKSPITEIENSLMIRTPRGVLKLISCKILKISNIKMWGDTMSYAFILRDITEYSKNETELRDAQNRVDSLLTKIMPKVIATRLMSKTESEDIISQVDKAVIIFIGIHDFISWCSTRGHEEIMQILDVIFSKFDKKIAKYPTLVKIKMINGVYMAAAGLFNEVSSRTPVHEAVEFCLDCGKWCMKRIGKGGMPIHLNIGVNYDGPIISGVLGREKPFFDVWGDAVNVSARLETSSYIDTIQMLPHTYHALPEGIYPARERHDVFLKGKGTTNTFYIPIPDADESNFRTIH